MTEQLALGGVLSIFCGLDRTAFLQLMISRPVFAAPLTGWVLGSAESGLLVGALLELLWLGRLPMGAAIPPDDTQVAVGATFLAIVCSVQGASPGLSEVLLALLLALPLGKLGTYFDQWARKANARLSARAVQDVARGKCNRLEQLHLLGMVHFALASLGAYLVIALGGWVLMSGLSPYLLAPLEHVQYWVFMIFPLVGMSHVLSSMNVNRALSLFASSFLMTYVLLWLM
ncbi:MAG: hypothetical protein C0624_06035 [Desulfuromonas sp.]|nr:MAG: hypothetical protein C0624_06035 [Desulfuromonas sp.]